MLRKASLLNFSIFILLLCVVFVGNTHSAAAATHNASGTYTYTSGTGELVLNWTSSDFTCDGPEIGQETWTEISLTETTMIWGGDDAMTWTRPSGTAGDIVGTWTFTDSSTGNSYDLTFNSNNTFSLVGTIVLCSDGTGTRNASGTYIYTFSTGLLEANFTSSDFTCDGPELGQETWTVTSLTETTMIWGGDDAMTWTRPSGTAGDIVGTWTFTDSSSGNSYDLTLNSNNTFSLVGIIVECNDDGDENPGAWGSHRPGGYYVSMKYRDSDQTATSVSITGPGITGSLDLPYDEDDGSWNTWGGGSLHLFFGTTYPAGLPYTYTFTITDGTGTWTSDSTVPCFQEQFVTNILPAGTVMGTPTFSWTGISDSAARYAVELYDTDYDRIWDNYNISGTSIVYDGPALTLGATYNYEVHLRDSSACSDQSSVAEGNFTVSFAIDNDNDGSASDVDCDDDDPDRFPGNPDICDGIDNDCDSDTPDGSGESWYGQGCDGPDSDTCMEGVYECVSSAQTCSDNTGDDPSICSGSLFILATPETTPTDSPYGITLQTRAHIAGERVQVDLIFDANNNGVMDAGEWVLISDTFADGSTVYFDYSDEMFSGDYDTTSPFITIRMHFWNGMFVPGNYIIRATNALGETATDTFTLVGLSNPITVTGTVYEEGTATPVPQAFIYCDQDDSDRLLSSAYTDSNGVYTLQFAEPGNCQIGTFKSGYVEQDDYIISVPAGGLTGQDLFLFPADTQISGTVTESGTGNPIGGVEVWTEAGDRESCDETDMNGDFTLYVTSGEDWEINAEKAGYISPQADVVPVPAGGISGHSIILYPPDAVITGTVTEYGTGNPVSGVNIAGDSLFGYNSHTYSGDDGQFILDVFAGDEWRVAAHSDLAGFFKILTPTNNYEHRAIIVPTTSGPNVVDFVAYRETAWVDVTVQTEDFLPVQSMRTYAGSNSSIEEFKNLYVSIETNSSGQGTIGIMEGDWHVATEILPENQPLVGGAARDLVPSASVNIADLAVGEHRPVTLMTYYADCVIEGRVFDSDGVTPATEGVVTAWTNNALDEPEQTDVGIVNIYTNIDDNGYYRIPVMGGIWNVNTFTFDWNMQSVTRNNIVCAPDWNNEIDQPNETIDGMDLILIPIGTDTDSDGIPDYTDNCAITSNPGQQDTDEDGYGNICDADLDNDDAVGFQDFIIFKAAWLSMSSSDNWNPDADFDSDGAVGFQDFIIFKGRWLTIGPWE